MFQTEKGREEVIEIEVLDLNGNDHYNVGQWHSLFDADQNSYQCCRFPFFTVKPFVCEVFALINANAEKVKNVKYIEHYVNPIIIIIIITWVYWKSIVTGQNVTSVTCVSLTQDNMQRVKNQCWFSAMLLVVLLFESSRLWVKYSLNIP